MKTAEEWAKEAKCDKFHHGECECFDRMGSKLQGSCDEIADLIRAAQRDAIEVAPGAVQGLRGPLIVNSGIGEPRGSVAYEAACRAARPLAVFS